MNFHNAQFSAAYGTLNQLPPSTMPEVSFAGKSNVGKSSLLNKLMYRKDLAKVSQQPGKTATINFYGIDTSSKKPSAKAGSNAGSNSNSYAGSKASSNASAKASSNAGSRTVSNAGCYFVDLPGYGYAKVAKSEKGRWSDLIEGYFNQDRDFALVLSLIDIRHDPTDLDAVMVQFLQEAKLPFCVVLTKADKLSRQQQIKQTAAIKKQLQLSSDTPIIVTSSEKNTGIDELRKLITAAIA